MSTTPNSTTATVAAAPRQGSDMLAAVSSAPDEPPSGGRSILDLVIAVGTDSSMQAAAKFLDGVLNASIDAAGKACPSSLRVTCLGVGAYFGTTRFNSSVSDYLALYVSDPSDLQEKPLPPGDLARAVIDLSRYFDWLPGANRAIFLVGDISLETVSDEVEKTTDAIAAARTADVKIYTCANLQRDDGSASKDDAATSAPTLTGKEIAQYMRLATQTCGVGYVCMDGATDFPWILQEVIGDNASSGMSDGAGSVDDGVDDCAHGKSCRCGECDQARLIVRTANMLSTVLRRVTDNYYPPVKGAKN